MVEGGEGSARAALISAWQGLASTDRMLFA